MNNMTNDDRKHHHDSRGDQRKENDKKNQLESFTVDHTDKEMRTNQGVPVSNDDDSLKAGKRGPTIMEDFHFREKMTHFDHERIPERVVHARGFGAHGYFQVYKPMTELTSAKFLQDPSVKTPVFVRFSTVVGSRGSADTVRDVRGFATKFYTEDGNFDIVGNNIPIFFIQDAMKFPDVVHAIKPEPHNEIPQASSAHDTFWDFVVNNTETAHMIMWLLSDRGIPRSFRMMEGFGVNTFRFVNGQGKARFVKFHWKPLLGVHSLVWDEAQKLAGKDPDFHRNDLWNAIEMGDYPEYELGVQVIEEDDEFKFDFDILDPTKFWPEEVVPVQTIGKLTLNRNVDNFFAETEQSAFHTGNVVPGVDFTNDPLLQGRLFSYLDTQLIRLGGPNFHEIPINRPITPNVNNQRDGFHRMTINRGITSYSVNAIQGNSPHPVSKSEGGYVHYAEKVEGVKIRARSESFKDHYSQATLFWNSMSEAEKRHIIEAFHFEIGKVDRPEIRQQVVDMFNNVDEGLAKEIAKGIGAKPPSKPGGTAVTTSSPAVSQENTIKTASTRKVAIIVKDKFHFHELKQVIKGFKGYGVHAELISDTLGTVKSEEGKEIHIDETFTTSESVMYDAVFIPGGKHVQQLLLEDDALHFIHEAFKHAKTIGASNEGVDVLANAQLHGIAVSGTDNSPTPIVSKGVISIRNAANMSSFTNAFVNALSKHRHWVREKQQSS
ncbi:catalase [Texcoconibacillus texcoconensis]|uniref:Catalase n=2 Tax=Texcoconibacillus texcoconensis TaxID=1095777 RepID=A0A840QPS8_9BACI|nr:catalase [Texcoconibacillus texcoconensis]